MGVHPSAQYAYQGAENIQPTDEASQARIYGQLIRFLACDPNVSSLLFFGLSDEPELDRWQAGLIRADGTLRPAYGAVKSTVAQTQGRCAGKKRSWRHTQTVLGAKAKFPSMGRFKPAKNRYGPSTPPPGRTPASKPASSAPARAGRRLPAS